MIFFFVLYLQILIFARQFRESSLLPFLTVLCLLPAQIALSDLAFPLGWAPLLLVYNIVALNPISLLP